MANTTKQVPGRWRRRAPAATFLALAAWALLGGSARAAEEPTLLLSGDAKGTTKSALVVQTGKKGNLTTYSAALRPNTEQGFYLLVHNPSKVQRSVSVRLKTGEKFQEVKAVDLKVDKGDSKLVDFKLPAAPAAPTTPGKPALPPTSELEVKAFTFPFAPPVSGQTVAPFTFAFMIELYDKDDERVLEQRRVNVRILSPKDYLDASAPLFRSQSDRQRNDWSVTLACRKDFTGPDCPVSLDLSPERIPGLLNPRPPGSRLEAKLNEQTRRVQLDAHNIPFLPVPEENGVVSVTADHFPRAFQFRTTFIREGQRTPDPILGETLRVGIPHYLKPEMKPIPVRLEADNWALDAPVQLDLGVDTTGKGSTFVRVNNPFPGVKDQHVWINPPAAEGFLRLRTTVKDWEVPVTTADLVGTCAFRLRVLDAKGKPVSKTAEAVTRVVVLDTPPEGIKVLLPKTIPVENVRMPVKATYAGPADHIKEVDFYLAAPVEGQIPKGAKPIRATRTEERGKPVWSAVLDVPRGQKGPLTVSARFVDQVGQAGVERADVERTAPAAPVAPTTGTIVGRVVKGTRPLGQANLPVILRDPKNMPVAQTTTDKDGNYTFKGVAPGNYTVYSEDASDNVRGSQAVSVIKGQQTKAKDIELSRLGR